MGILTHRVVPDELKGSSLGQVASIASAMRKKDIETLARQVQELTDYVESAAGTVDQDRMLGMMTDMVQTVSRRQATLNRQIEMFNQKVDALDAKMENREHVFDVVREPINGLIEKIVVTETHKGNA